tara:strand:+ start:7332 stop:7535 length:204 start_codon:yes stop_codon:yes gene_type:complete
MKIIWLWKNIFKVIVCVLLAAIFAGVLSYALGLSESGSALLGMVIGVVAILTGMVRWDLYRFEFKVN